MHSSERDRATVAAVSTADVTRIRWRIRGVDPDSGRFVREQTARAGVEGDRIALMTLVCSGGRPLAG